MSCGRELATFQVRQSGRLRLIKIAAIVGLVNVMIERNIEQSEKLLFVAKTVRRKYRFIAQRQQGGSAIRTFHVLSFATPLGQVRSPCSSLVSY